MSNPQLQTALEAAWEKRDEISIHTRGEIREAVDETLELLDSGQVRVAEKTDGAWTVHPWVKKAILLSFQLRDTVVMLGGARDTASGEASWFDKIPPKFAGWNEDRFRTAGFRAVPGCVVRYGAYIAPKVVLMPCFVNIGARVESGSMIDTWATVGSCAQIGRNVHLSGGAGIGGVLEPVQANPVIIEDDCFIGARAEVAEGVVVEQGAVLAMGVYLGASTKIVDRATGVIHLGRVPAYSVVVPGALPGPAFPDGSPGPALYCAVIVKKVDEKTRAKTSINELLRT